MSLQQIFVPIALTLPHAMQKFLAGVQKLNIRKEIPVPKEATNYLQ
jgi:hypothetical protein